MYFICTQCSRHQNTLPCLRPKWLKSLTLAPVAFKVLPTPFSVVHDSTLKTQYKTKFAKDNLHDILLLSPFSLAFDTFTRSTLLSIWILCCSSAHKITSAVAAPVWYACRQSDCSIALDCLLLALSSHKLLFMPLEAPAFVCCSCWRGFVPPDKTEGNRAQVCAVCLLFLFDLSLFPFTCLFMLLWAAGITSSWWMCIWDLSSRLHHHT